MRMESDSDPKDRPAFLNKERALATSYPGADDIPQFDDELPATEELSSEAAPVAGVTERYREIARLHALGKTNNQICTLLGYTPSRVSLLLRDPFVVGEVARYRKNLFQQDVADKLKEASRDGAILIHKIILDEKEKTALRLDAAKWSNEKTYGKAKQEVDVESHTLLAFMNLMKEMKDRGEVLDVSPVQPELTGQIAEPAETQSAWSDWLDQNIK